jgi:pyridoxine 5-phosphate synthase
MPVKLTNHSAGSGLPRINSGQIVTCAKRLLDLCGRADHGLGILLVGDEEMARMNNQYRGKNAPTNVLSFPFFEGIDDSVASLPIKELGDIVISVDTAEQEATGSRQTLQERLAWLLTHGLLHLLGYDHERSESEAVLMQEKENELLLRLHHYRSKPMTHLAINVDHIATLRQARGINEPDPVTAAAICELAGASGIVVHLREDRRHIQDRDVQLLRQTVKTKLNLEMGAAKEIIDIALNLQPDMVTLVPEKRLELTTEGGLNVAGQKKKLAAAIEQFRKAGIPVSLFIDPDSRQIKASHEIGATFVEIHTGKYCDATTDQERDYEFQLIAAAAQEAYEMGLRVNAGHGLDYQTTARIAALDVIEELSIGHAVIVRAVFTGLEHAVREMLAIVRSSSGHGF